MGTPASATAARAETRRGIVRTAREQIESLDPGFSSRVEVTDVATPPTFARYTGNWKGTYMAWVLSSEFQRQHRYISKTVSGLSGLYLACVWTTPPGGLLGAALAGRDVVQLLCHEDRQRFVGSTP